MIVGGPLDVRQGAAVEGPIRRLGGYEMMGLVFVLVVAVVSQSYPEWIYDHASL